MANRYFVAGTGLWNNTNNWSASSGGGGGAGVPTSSDDVYFDANSPSCTLDINGSCASVTTTGYVAGRIIDSAGFDLSVTGALAIIAGVILNNSTGTSTITADTITNSGTIKPTAAMTITSLATGSDFTVGTVTKDAGSDTTLTLKSGLGIVVNSAITSSLNKLGLILDARYADAATGQINITAAITTNGGNITMGGGSVAIGVNSGYAIGSSGSSNKAFGVYISGPVTAGGGNIIVNGQGYNTTTDSNHGVSISNVVSTSGSGTIDIYGIGKGTVNSGGDYGMSIVDGSVIGVDGNLTLNATGGGAGTGVFNVGIAMANATIKTTGSGDVSITAVGGPGTGVSQHGIYLFTDSSIQTTGTGNIIISATTGSLATGGSTLGLTLSSATSSIVGAKNVAIIATSLGVGGQYNYGLNMTTGSSITTAADGNISITATGGSSASSDNYGLRLRGPISTTGTGTITITSTAGGITNSGNNYGIYGSDAGYVSSQNGDITITSTGGGAGSGTNNRGIYLRDAGTYFKTTGSGNLTVNAIRGGGDTATNYGLYLAVANALQTVAGNITVNTDTIFLTEINDINSAAALTIAPYTAATTVGVAGGTGTLGLTSAYLGYLGYATLQIGNSAETGTMTIGAYASWTKPVSFVVKSTANISMSGSQTVGSSGSFTFAGNVDFTTSVINMGGDMTLTACTTVAAASADFIADGSGAQAIRLAGSKWLTITVTNPDATTVTFYDGFETDELILTTPGSRIKFESTKIFKVNTLLQIFGTSASHVTIEATSSGSAWILNAVCPVRECGYVNVKDSNNNSGTDIYCSFGTNNGGNSHWIFVDKYIWDGLGVGNLASTKENWVGDIAPVTTNAVLFNATGTKDCTWDLTPHFSMMEVDTGYVGTLTLTQDLYLDTNFDQQDGTIVHTNGCTKITIEGNMIIGAGGTFTAAVPIEVWQDISFDSIADITLSGAIFNLNGWASQNISFGNKTLGSLTIPNTFGIISLLEGFTVGSFTISPAVIVHFGAGETFIATDIIWDGSLGNNIVLRSTIDGSNWLLIVAGGDMVSFVDVKNSDATGGGIIRASKSIDQGENFNWYFEVECGLIRIRQYTISSQNPGPKPFVNIFNQTLRQGSGVTVTNRGVIFVSDAGRHVIWKLNESLTPTIFAGKLNTSGFVNGNATNARFNTPKDIVCDDTENLYVFDYGNNKIRKIDTNGKVSTVTAISSSIADMYLSISPNGNIFAIASKA